MLRKCSTTGTLKRTFNMDKSNAILMSEFTEWLTLKSRDWITFFYDYYRVRQELLPSKARDFDQNRELSLIISEIQNSRSISRDLAYTAMHAKNELDNANWQGSELADLVQKELTTISFLNIPLKSSITEASLNKIVSHDFDPTPWKQPLEELLEEDPSLLDYKSTINEIKLLTKYLVLLAFLHHDNLEPILPESFQCQQSLIPFLPKICSSLKDSGIIDQNTDPKDFECALSGKNLPKNFKPIIWTYIASRNKEISKIAILDLLDVLGVKPFCEENKLLLGKENLLSKEKTKLERLFRFPERVQKQDFSPSTFTTKLDKNRKPDPILVKIISEISPK